MIPNKWKEWNSKCFLTRVLDERDAHKASSQARRFYASRISKTRVIYRLPVACLIISCAVPRATVVCRGTVIVLPDLFFMIWWSPLIRAG